MDNRVSSVGVVVVVGVVGGAGRAPADGGTHWTRTERRTRGKVVGNVYRMQRSVVWASDWHSCRSALGGRWSSMLLQLEVVPHLDCCPTWHPRAGC